jgi:hypothetical protein
VVHGLTSEDSGLQGRCNLVKDQFLGYLKDRSKRLYRLATSTTSSHAHPTDNSSKTTKDIKSPSQITNNNDTIQKNETRGIAIVQLFLVQPGTVLVSVTTTSHTLPSSLTSKQIKGEKEKESTQYAAYGWSRPFPWERGLEGEIPTPPQSKNPPSRAYRKLDEILAVIGECPPPRSLVVDLGSAPGGWTYRLANDLVCLLVFISPLYSFLKLFFIFIDLSQKKKKIASMELI